MTKKTSLSIPRVPTFSNFFFLTFPKNKRHQTFFPGLSEPSSIKKGLNFI